LGYLVDDVAGDATGEEPAGVGNDSPYGVYYSYGLVFASIEKLLDLVFTGVLVRWVPASGKNGFPQIHGSASFYALTLKSACLNRLSPFRCLKILS
jgi:hypothetical protein